MNTKYNDEQKQETIQRYQNGISIADITADTGEYPEARSMLG